MAGSCSERLIFLSHTGAQKTFVKRLDELLRYLGCEMFLDETDLPAGQRYEPKIWEAAGRCKLAVVVLSDEFFSKNWPMKELLYFIDRTERDASFYLLPLFYRISVEGLDQTSKWHGQWMHYGFDVSKCERALKKLGSYSGVVFKPEEESEGGYLERCKEKIIHESIGVEPDWLKHKRLYGVWPS